jgi:hydroxymethylglutaryl-CoA lyase
VRVVEVGPRDGLQNESAAIPTPLKAAFIQALADAGLPAIEVTAFVHPDRVPQMADAAALCRALEPRPGVRYSALVPNLKGLSGAIDCGLTEVAVFVAASETFSRRNINQGVDESLASYAEVARRAREAGLRVRAYLSTAFGCPFEGDVPVGRVADIAARLLDLGAYEVAISDTIGVGHPGQVWDVLDAVAERVPVSAVALHLHDTRGTALANVLAGLEAGVEVFDASAGGLGGCPFAPGAAGNLATEDLIYMLDGMGIQTGVRLDGVAAASTMLQPHVGHALPSRYLQSRERSRH